MQIIEVGGKKAKPLHKCAFVCPDCGFGVRKRRLACVSVARQGRFLCWVTAAAGRGFYSSLFGFGQTQHIFNLNSWGVLSIWGCMRVTPGYESLGFICVSSNKSVISVCVCV